MPAPRSRFRWNDATGQYIGPDGRFVARAQIRLELDYALEQAGKRITLLAEQLRGNQIGLNAWRVAMRNEIRQVHLYSAAAAKGGWAQMNLTEYGRVGAVVRSEYAYLDRFAREIRRGYPLDGFFMQRTTLYTEAARETYHRVERADMQRRGMDEERNIEDRAAEHCEGANSCHAQTLRKWVKIGQLVPIGRRRCGRRCRCHISYRRSVEARAA